VPSTLTVTNNLDSGLGSLRAEIAAAKSGDTISFATSLNTQTEHFRKKLGLAHEEDLGKTTGSDAARDFPRGRSWL